MLTLDGLRAKYGTLEALPLLDAMINNEFAGKIGLVSSFGSGSALLLAMVAEVNAKTPVMFLETGKHFDETLEYVETLRNMLGLENLQMLVPDPQIIENIDQAGDLWQLQPNRCCWARKVEPLERAISESGLQALITGRKRYQTPQRAQMETIELNEDGRFRINPMAYWDKKMLKAEFIRRGLPEHPLVSKGYPSIGCAPCTSPVKEGEDERAGRWAHTAQMPGGEQKVECGIHIEGDNKPVKPEGNW